MTKQFTYGEVKSAGVNGIFSGIASTQKQDRDGDTIDQRGWELSGYLKSPVLLFGHNPHVPPIGKTFNQRITDRGLEFDFAFAETSMAKEVKSLVEGGFLTSFSVGFIPKEYGEPKRGEPTFKSAELLEISLVTIPSNTDALVTSRTYKELSQETKQYIEGEIIRHKQILVEHGNESFPMRAKDHVWDEDAERKLADTEDLKRMALVYDETAPNDRDSYKLLHHAASKEYPIILEAVKNALSKLDEVPEEHRESARAHLEKHLEVFGEKKQSDEQDEQKSFELADEDRKLLERVAVALDSKEAQEELIKTAQKGRSFGKNVDQNKIMVRALQIIAKTVNKRLCEMKKTYGKERN